ncbi:MAG: DNA polymerase III subunit gamma/tau [Parcubacteria group bacterium]|nr:DNA polymerase III subunit gamma/tau [Parcubacteria group bacterium]
MGKAISRTYRPSTFKEVSGQEHVVRTIQNQHASESLAHAYLFTGPRGVGKTTIARLIAALVNCENPTNNEPCNTCSHCQQIRSGQALDVYEIDAASNTGVDNVRESIIDSVRFMPNLMSKKVYIIDEVHMLSTSAFNALLKTLEEPPAHVMFVLATTEIHKVPETIISRCQRFDFRRIAKLELVERMEKILLQEDVKVDVDVLEEIARHSEGCARDAESLLGQVLALGEKNITMKEAVLVLPATQTVLVEEFIQALNSKDAKTSIELLNTYLEQGIDLRHFVQDVVRLLRDQLLLNVAAGESASVPGLSKMITELLEAQREIRGEQIPQLPVELAIVRICGVSSQVVHEVVVSQTIETKTEEVIPVSIETDESPPAEDSVDFNKQEVDSVRPDNSVGADATVFDTVPVISLDDVKSKWPEVYEQIKSCNASLPLMMRGCEVRGVEGERVELGFEYDLYVQTVNQEKNRNVIEGVLEQVLGKRMKIKAIQSKLGRGPADETVDSLIQDFGGSVV